LPPKSFESALTDSLGESGAALDHQRYGAGGLGNLAPNPDLKSVRRLP